jgi:hypothetical protein
LMGWQIKLADTKRLGEKRYSAGRLFTLSGKRECRGSENAGECKGFKEYILLEANKNRLTNLDCLLALI